jgi:predicted nucleic acid-binding protein
VTAVVIADTNAMYRLLDPHQPRHEQHRMALAATSHLVISPMVLTELDCLISQRAGAEQALAALRFVQRYTALSRFEVPDVGHQLGTAVAVMETYQDADQGHGVGLADAMNVALAAGYRTDRIFTTDQHCRMMRPLTGHPAFRLLPDDL